jgi:hypothetical protein
LSAKKRAEELVCSSRVVVDEFLGRRSIEDLLEIVAARHESHTFEDLVGVTPHTDDERYGVVVEALCMPSLS